MVIHTSTPSRIAPPRLVSLSGAPLREASATNRLEALAGLPGQDLVARYFTAQEFAALNPGRYHNPDHPVLVAEVAGELGGPERGTFLQQVALLHDADERLDLKTGERNEVSPARAQVTLEWMDLNQAALQSRLDWSATDFVEAKALVARTDFPFDDQPRNFGTRYDGQSPLGVYRELLRELPVERQERVMEEGLALRFADQVANYTVNPQVSEAFVAGLGEELHWPGVRTSTAGFLQSVGSDLAFDRQLAAELGIPARLAPAPELQSRLTPARQTALIASQEWFMNS